MDRHQRELGQNDALQTFRIRVIDLRLGHFSCICILRNECDAGFIL